MRDEDELLIYQLYADRGVECEYFSGYGRVIRIGINPFENQHSEVIQADATQPPLKQKADLVICHPPCYKWAEATRHIYDKHEKYDNLIPEARQAGVELGEDYIIENVPRAPLRDPVILNGRMFNMPIHYERAFETSFYVPQPPEHQKRDDEITWWEKYSRPLNWWLTTKGYHNKYNKDSLVKTAVPKQYLDYLFQFYFTKRYNLSISNNKDDPSPHMQASIGEWSSEDLK